MKQQRVILALLALVAGLSEGRLGPVRSGRAQVSSVPNGVSAKCTSSHLEENCAVTGLPVIKDIGFDAKIDDVNYVINVDILWDGKSYSILNLSAHNPEVCIDELVVAKVCAKVENLQWADDRVTGTLYVGVGVVIVGTEYFKVVDLDVPYAARDVARARKALALGHSGGSGGGGASQCVCMRATPGRASFSTPGTCVAQDGKYASLCAKEKDEDSCDQQTLVGCSWEGHPCSKDAECKQYCPAPDIGSRCLPPAPAVKAARQPVVVAE